MEVFRLIQSDFQRYNVENKSEKSFIHLWLANPGLWVLTVYRLRRSAHLNCSIPLIRQLFILLTDFFSHLLKFMTCIELPSTVELGKGCFIPHIGSIVISYKAIIGNNCTITQGVTIGEGGRGEKSGSPRIGSQVYIAPGAKILGPLQIGDYALIGANAVVIRDVPENAVVGGIPAKILNYKGSRDFMSFMPVEESSK